MCFASCFPLVKQLFCLWQMTKKSLWSPTSMEFAWCSVLIITFSHRCIECVSVYASLHTQTHNEGMAKLTTHVPLYVNIQWGFCTASMPLCLCHVFHIIVLVWCVPAGGGVGALSQGCACGPNPLINSASTGHRWQVGTEKGCTPLQFFCCCQDPEISLTSIHSLLLMNRCWYTLEL